MAESQRRIGDWTVEQFKEEVRAVIFEELIRSNREVLERELRVERMERTQARTDSDD